MKINQKLLSVLSVFAVMLLCCVNVTYAWESMNQAAWNIYVEEAEEEPPNPDETPDERPPVEPDEKPKPQPEKPTVKPVDPSKPTEVYHPQEPSGSSQMGSYEMTTGDTCRFVVYMIIMLFSFVVIILLGSVLMALAIHEWEKEKLRQEENKWEENRLR